MSIHTESYESVKNEDGTITTTEVTTYIPPTKKEKAIAWTVFGGLMVAPFAPLIAAVAYDKYVEKREARKARKAEQKS